MITKELGKIQSAELVLGGRDDDTLGVSFSFSGTGWGVSDFWTLATTEAGQFSRFSTGKLATVLNAAKVKSLSQLKGKPVEVMFKDQCIDTWRILTEVL